jgi:hypothetical protein
LSSKLHKSIFHAEIETLLHLSGPALDNMVEVSLKFDAPFKTKDVSSEETRAKLDEFRKMPWLQPDYKEATLEGLQTIERY